jgi:hypothetical protein
MCCCYSNCMQSQPYQTQRPTRLTNKHYAEHLHHNACVTRVIYCSLETCLQYVLPAYYEHGGGGGGVGGRTAAGRHDERSHVGVLRTRNYHLACLAGLLSNFSRMCVQYVLPVIYVHRQCFKSTQRCCMAQNSQDGVMLWRALLPPLSKPKPHMAAADVQYPLQMTLLCFDLRQMASADSLNRATSCITSPCTSTTVIHQHIITSS